MKKAHRKGATVFIPNEKIQTLFQYLEGPVWLQVIKPQIVNPDFEGYTLISFKKSANYLDSLVNAINA